MKTKICTSCKIEKKIDNFSIRNKETGSRRCYCTRCTSDRSLASYHKNKQIRNVRKNAEPKICSVTLLEKALKIGAIT
jgi:hypothetical protein